jgi:hypothetical protein
MYHTFVSYWNLYFKCHALPHILVEIFLVQTVLSCCVNYMMLPVFDFHSTDTFIVLFILRLVATVGTDVSLHHHPAQIAHIACQQVLVTFPGSKAAEALS